MTLEGNGKTWWIRLRGEPPPVTDGERSFMLGTEEDWLREQEIRDAGRLIATKDPEAIKIGRAKLRACLGRELPEDFDLFK
ncbi:hypothetical protein A2Z22_01125 [Candidatus Woesebacteria bacterium RBG_16_34_12]|uniref:Uncharacterized protein n=1 Tax=Candidatus Woesebacteria bacterium RBG_16_34_12 TaxID=1802480 RepID=A0A1F7X7Z5_9BACT|nr:MAG: hypothetical protein A2Z22_01125 [Candidatus Woesebacteria bacterium RBG_16_34_12]